MTSGANLDEAIEGLQQLGLQEYEARCFVGLTRLSSGTAKKLSEITEVPRTRVYDAIRVLETKGLVEIHHSSPQQFRAVPLEEAMETLRDQYESRVKQVQTALEETESIESGDESPVQEVWSINGADAIQNRLTELLNSANEEIILVIGDQSVLTAEVAETLNDRTGEIDVMIGTSSESLQREVADAVPGSTTFTSGLEWIQRVDDTGTAPVIGVILLADRSTILVSSILPDSGEEHAIYGRGFGNGFVVIARRIISRGLLQIRDSTG